MPKLWQQKHNKRAMCINTSDKGSTAPNAGGLG